MISLTKQAVLDLLTKKKRTLILFHRNPDADALGSALALAEALTQMGSEVRSACESPLPERLSFLLAKEPVAFGKENLPKNFSPERVIAVDTASPTQLGELFPLFEGRVDLSIDHHELCTPFSDH